MKSFGTALCLLAALFAATCVAGVFGDDQAAPTPTKPTLPTKFWTQIASTSSQLSVSDLTVAFDISRYPAYIQGRENYTARGNSWSNIFDGEAGKLHLYSEGYRGSKCRTLEYTQENVEDHPAFQILNYLGDFNQDVHGDKWTFQGPRLMSGQPCDKWQSNEQPSLYICVGSFPDHPLGLRRPNMLQDGDFVVRFPRFTELITTPQRFDAYMSRPATPVCQPAIMSPRSVEV